MICFPLVIIKTREIKLDLSNYTTKSWRKNATGADISNFAKKANLASLKSDVEKLDMNKLVKPPSGLTSLESKVDNVDFDKLKLLKIKR